MKRRSNKTQTKPIKFEGGNDSAVIPTGIDTVQVSGPTDVKYLINQFPKK